MKRRVTRAIRVGNVAIGGGAPVSIQSMIRLIPQAHAERMPHSVDLRFFRFTGPNTLNTPFVATSGPVQSAATSWLQ